MVSILTKTFIEVEAVPPCGIGGSQINKVPYEDGSENLAKQKCCRFMELLLASSFGPFRNFVLAHFCDKEFISLLGVGTGWSEAQRSPQGVAFWA